MKKLTILILFAAFSLVSQPGWAEEVSTKFSLLSYNTWGVPVASWDTWRYRDAMDKITEMTPDVVILQEVFTRKGRQAFQSSDYPYVVKGPRAQPRLVSSGLRILSRHPVIRSASLVYRSCKKDDCLARKGAVLAVIELPNHKRITIVGTHLNARGGDAPRTDQLVQLNEFVRYYAEPNTPVVIAGDFNFEEHTAPYNYITQHMNSTDQWNTLRPNDPGFTYDSTQNDYAREYSLRTGFPLSQERIDYVFTLNEAAPIQATSIDVLFNEKPFLSDHFGLFTQFKF